MKKRRTPLLAASLVPALILTGFTLGGASELGNSATASSVSLSTPALANYAVSGAAGVALPAGSLAGRKIFVDPGHNGKNDSSITRQVPTGRGGTKDCQTTGTSGVDGLPEHSFNYAVAYQLYQILTAAGAQVLLSRNDDASVGPCVDARAIAANNFGAHAAVSIHADGSAAGNRGFHVNLSAPPLNAVQQTASPAYAKAMRDALVAGGFTPANYIGTDGLFPRPDLTGLNLATVPSVMVEAGNMRDSADQAVLASPAGQQRLANAIASGLAAFLATT